MTHRFTNKDTEAWREAWMLVQCHAARSGGALSHIWPPRVECPAAPLALGPRGSGHAGGGT